MDQFNQYVAWAGGLWLFRVIGKLGLANPGLKEVEERPGRTVQD